jgi:hypothetical protein
MNRFLLCRVYRNQGTMLHNKEVTERVRVQCFVQYVPRSFR